MRGIVATALAALLAGPALAQSDLMLLGVGGGGSGGGYVPPAIVALMGCCDSRTENAINFYIQSSQLESEIQMVTGYFEGAMLGSNNNLLPSASASYGVGGTTSLNARDRMTVASMYGTNGGTSGIQVGTTPTNTGSGTGTETMAPVSATVSGGFPGWKTPGAWPSPTGTVTVTFGTQNSVNASCATGTGYTPFTLSDSAGDTFASPSGCIQDANSATATYGGTPPSHNDYANFTITQPASGQRAMLGDTFVWTTFGPEARAFKYTGTSGAGVDAYFNIEGPGNYSPVSDPANVVFFVDGINDSPSVFATPTSGTAYSQCPGDQYASYTSMPAVAPCLGMVSTAGNLDALIAQGKFIFLADETPQGESLAYFEKHTVAASATTATATNGATFLYDGNQFATTTGLGQSVPNIPGLVAQIGASTTPQVYTLVGSLTGTNYQYTVSAAGVYTINATDPLSTSGGSVWLTYSYGSGSTGPSQKILHQWLASSASDFVYSGAVTGCNGGIAPCDYHFPGALYNRPAVTSVPLFEAMVDTRSYSASDPGCVTHNCVAIPPGLDSLSKHPTLYSVDLLRQAFHTVWNSIPSYAALADNYNPPQWGNLTCAKGNGATLTWSCTIGNTMQGTGHPCMSVYFTEGSTVYSATDPGVSGVCGATGSFTAGAGASYIASSSISYSTGGTVSITFKTGDAPANLTYIDLVEDPLDAANNPMFDATSGIGYASEQYSPCVGSGVTKLPTGWNCTDAGTTGLTFIWATGTDGSGNPTLSLSITGIASGAGNVVLANSLDTNHTSLMSGHTAREQVEQTVSDYGGALYGLYSYLTYQINVSAGSTYNNIYAISGTSAGQTGTGGSFSSVKFEAGNVTTATAYPWTDLDIAGISGNSSGNTIKIVGQPMEFAKYTPSAQGTFQPAVQWAAGPVNGTITWELAAVKVRS